MHEGGLRQNFQNGGVFNVQRPVKWRTRCVKAGLSREKPDEWPIYYMPFISCSYLKIFLFRNRLFSSRKTSSFFKGISSHIILTSKQQQNLTISPNFSFKHITCFQMQILYIKGKTSQSQKYSHMITRVIHK